MPSTIPTVHPLLIGIDPDTERSGWACIDYPSRIITLERLPLLDLLDRLDQWNEEPIFQVSAHFVLENIWKTGHNWHVKKTDTRPVIAKKGYHLGRCASIGEVIRDALTAHDFPRIYQDPLLKHWKGKDGKITHEELLQVCKRNRLHLDKAHLKRSHQDERDAALLAIHHLGSPITLFTKDK